MKKTNKIGRVTRSWTREACHITTSIWAGRWFWNYSQMFVLYIGPTVSDGLLVMKIIPDFVFNPSWRIQFTRFKTVCTFPAVNFKHVFALVLPVLFSDVWKYHTSHSERFWNSCFFFWIVTRKTIEHQITDSIESNVYHLMRRSWLSFAFQKKWSQIREDFLQSYGEQIF